MVVLARHILNAIEQDVDVGTSQPVSQAGKRK
jgi:hypothetical protein